MRISDWSSDVCSSDLALNTKPQNDSSEGDRPETASPENETTLREVVGFFHGEEPLFRAVSDLESAGIDRAELSLLPRESLVGANAEGEPAAAKDPQTGRDTLRARM